MGDNMTINLGDVYGSKVLTGSEWIKQSTSYIWSE